MSVNLHQIRLTDDQYFRLREGLSQFSRKWNNAAILDSCGLEGNTFPTESQGFSLLAGFSDSGNSFGFFTDSPPPSGRWYFGHLCYELRDKTVPGSVSSHPSLTDFSEEKFWAADLVFILRGRKLEVQAFNGSDPAKVLEEVLNLQRPEIPLVEGSVTAISKTDYLANCAQIYKHLMRGDIYELNFCIPFKLDCYEPDIAGLWRILNETSPAPFSALYRENNSWLLCASPERFLKRTGNKLFSQPIKGTIRRSDHDEADEKNKLQLLQSEKERAENIMITDLVRNDFSKIAKRGTVKVEELCGLYSFRHVHQLITTVSAVQDDDVSIKDILTALFPMGSMTGAPKYRAMELIEELESFRREIFSGSVGYISPEGDFDFNVVIRSIIFNASKNLIIIPAGSAITAVSDHEKEYEECLLKAEALLKLTEKLKGV